MINDNIKTMHDAVAGEYVTMESEFSAYSILRKEIEEAYEAIGHLGFWLDNLWTQIKKGDTAGELKFDSVNSMIRYCEDGINGFARVAAVCEMAKELYPVAPEVE